MAVDVATWLQRFAAEAGVPAPSAEEQESLLALAGVAAHASERIAAPLSCWLAARAGVDPAAALAMAQRLADDLADDPDASRGTDAGTAETAETRAK